MAAGDTVNTAARVQSVAEPKSVRVDEDTQRLAGAAIGFADVGEHVLKGKAEPCGCGEPPGCSPEWAASNESTAWRPPSPVGTPSFGVSRTSFTAQSTTYAAPGCRLGPAGVGKSRLGWEFEKYVDGIADTVLWHRGRCLSYGEGVAFWALAEIVRQRFGIAEEDATEVAAGKLEQGWSVLWPTRPSATTWVLRLSRLLGVSSAQKRGLAREELYAGWRLFFERLAAGPGGDAHRGRPPRR